MHANAHPHVPVGASLLEVVVVIAILGVIGTVVGLSWQLRGRALEPDDRSPAALVAAARRQALASGASITIRVDAGEGGQVVTALPDGRLLGAESLGFNPLTGRRTDSISQRLETAASPDPLDAGRTGRAGH